MVLCSSLFGTLVFLGVRRTMSARERERTLVFGVIPRLYTGLYATPGPLLAAPPAFNPHRQKYENYRPKNKMNTARRRRRRDNKLTNQLFFQLWSGLVIQKPWGCTRGCDAQALAQALKMRQFHTSACTRLYHGLCDPQKFNCCPTLY